MAARRWVLNVFDPERIRQVALALRTNGRYVEKDFHLVRALSVIASIKVDGVMVDVATIRLLRNGILSKAELYGM